MQKNLFSLLYLMISVNIHRIARMGYFDDYSGFQQIPGMPILLQQSLHHSFLLKSLIMKGYKRKKGARKMNLFTFTSLVEL